MEIIRPILCKVLAVLTIVLALAAGTAEAQDAGQAQAEGQSQAAVEEQAGLSPQTLALFDRVATALDEKSISRKTLEQLRSQLVEVRNRNTAIVKLGNVKADAIAAQLESLGPPPGEGKVEADEITKRRMELTNALAVEDAPAREAEETLKYVGVLIRKVDEQLRARQLDKLLMRYPSPLFPSTWETGLKDLETFRKRLDRDISNELERPSIAQRLKDNAPIAIALAIFGFVFLLLLQRPVLRILLNAAERRQSGPKGIVFAILFNLGLLVLPAIGIIAILSVVRILGVEPNSAKTVVAAVPVMAFCLVIANWMGHTLFSPWLERWRLLDLSGAEARLGLYLCQGLGVFLVLEIILESLERDNSFDPATISIVSAPLIAMAAVLLWMLSGLLRSNERKRQPVTAAPSAQAAQAEGKTEPQELGFLMVQALLMKVASVLAIAVALAGYVQVARAATLPMIMTVAQLGIGYMLYHAVLLIIKAVMNKGYGEEVPGLVSIAVAFVLSLVFLPLIAMTWGARATDIVEVWRLLTTGIQIGDIRLSLDSFLILVCVFGVGLFVTRWLQSLLKKSVLPQTRLDTGAQTAMVTGLGYVGLTLSVLIAVATAGMNLSSLAVVAGALSVGIGFGLQTIVSNFVSGIILLIERPVKEGDWIEVSGQSGYVRKISVRSTRIETFDRHDVIIPNSELIAGTVKNMTLSTRSGRLILPVGVAYGSDLEKVKSILLEAASGHSGIVRYPAPMVLFTGLGDSSLDFELRCFLKNVETIMTTQSDLYFTIYNELGGAGIEIPFPQRDLHLKDIDRLVTAIERRPEDGGRPTEPAAEAGPPKKEPDALS
ncbi:mechanosensitive ion channel domain-containing protein [Roseibium sp.]|uniref:mechanosensitive ion channel domain-containing protein n=1 Tax=Roseibium sp. TaxID=1936156 RepID=UPI003D102152